MIIDEAEVQALPFFWFYQYWYLFTILHLNCCFCCALQGYPGSRICRLWLQVPETRSDLLLDHQKHHGMFRHYCIFLVCFLFLLSYLSQFAHITRVRWGGQSEDLKKKLPLFSWLLLTSWNVPQETPTPHAFYLNMIRGTKTPTTHPVSGLYGGQKGFCVRKAAGPDGVPGCVLHVCADQLLEFLISILNLSLSTAVIPVWLKTTTIVPLPK